jgi:hypothetical protein
MEKGLIKVINFYNVNTLCTSGHGLVGASGHAHVGPTLCFTSTTPDLSLIFIADHAQNTRAQRRRKNTNASVKAQETDVPCMCDWLICTRAA